MSRRHQAEKRDILPDAKYGDIIITRTINLIMKDGKKSAAERIFYNAMERVEKKLRRNPVEAFHDALNNLKPEVEVRSRRVGGATYQVPCPVRPERQQALAIRWLISFARKRGERTMEERMTGELLDILESRGGAMKKREETHKMAEANRAFAHYRW